MTPIHQSIKGQRGESRRIACGADFEKVASTPFCDAVTCPACIAWADRVVAAVFTPLEPRPEFTFTGAYWDFLQNKRPDEPDPIDHGLSEEAGEEIGRRVHREFEADIRERAQRGARRS